VDLIQAGLAARAVPGKADCSVSLAAVKVADEQSLYLPRHSLFSALAGLRVIPIRIIFQ
jgi:hypothetical protein